jgi:Mg2+ and Co2+ transporter CorA
VNLVDGRGWCDEDGKVGGADDAFPHPASGGPLNTPQATRPDDDRIASRFGRFVDDAPCDMVCPRSQVRPKVDLELQRNLRDVHDHAIRVVERADSFRALLQNALSVHTTLIGQQQNDEMRSLTEASLAQNEEVKRISSWAAILFAPTLVGTIYGMNFTHMPELRWTAGYPLAIALMVATSVTLYLVFKRRGWL